jgi:hypothetical protein
VRAKAAFHPLPIYDFRAGPAFWRLKNDHRPTWSSITSTSRGLLNFLDLSYYAIQSANHQRMHERRIIAGHEVRLPPAAGTSPTIPRYRFPNQDRARGRKPSASLGSYFNRAILITNFDILCA